MLLNKVYQTLFSLYAKSAWQKKSAWEPGSPVPTYSTPLAKDIAERRTKKIQDLEEKIGELKRKQLEQQRMANMAAQNEAKAKKSWSNQVFSLFFRLLNFSRVNKLFVFLIVWAGAKQSRSPGAEQPTQVRVYQLPVGVDGLASLARLARPSTPTGN